MKVSFSDVIETILVVGTIPFQIFCKFYAIYSISCSLINNPSSSPVLLAYCNNNTALIRTPFYAVYYSFLKLKSKNGAFLVLIWYNANIFIQIKYLRLCTQKVCPLIMWVQVPKGCISSGKYPWPSEIHGTDLIYISLLTKTGFQTDADLDFSQINKIWD